MIYDFMIKPDNYKIYNMDLKDLFFYMFRDGLISEETFEMQTMGFYRKRAENYINWIKQGL